jgi:DNA-binding transcriptional regulator GbsR (MarR family)
MRVQHTTIDPELLEFVDKVGLFYESAGVPRISGRIVGLLLVVEEPMSPEEMSKILGVSRSSISTNLAVLRLYKFIEEVRYPGDRKEFFKYSENAMENILRIKLSQYDPFRTILQEGMDYLKNKNSNQDKISDLLKYLELEENHFHQLMQNWKNFHKTTSKKKEF